MKPTQTLNKGERFFFDNAAYSWNPKKQTPEQGRTECAKRLFEAEQAYHDAEAYASVTFRIGPDADGCDPDDDNPGHRYVMWIEDGDGRCRASLHGIDDDGAVYSRVVRAELALDIIDELRELYAAEMPAD